VPKSRLTRVLLLRGRRGEEGSGREVEGGKRKERKGEREGRERKLVPPLFE